MKCKPLLPRKCEYDTSSLLFQVLLQGNMIVIRPCLWLTRITTHDTEAARKKGDIKCRPSFNQDVLHWDLVDCSLAGMAVWVC